MYNASEVYYIKQEQEEANRGGMLNLKHRSWKGVYII